MNNLAKKITIDPDLEITCASCGRKLVINDESPYRNWPCITVECCENCSDYDRGYDVGCSETRGPSFDEGHQEGFEEGFKKGKEAALED